MSDQPVRIHLGVTRALQVELERGGVAALEDFAKRLEISHVRGDRLERFGIISADADASSLEKLRAHPGIEFVEQDTKRKAI